jgi:hypothetical protein
MIKIINWSSYQSYKDRKPPWIRFHKTMLDNFKYHRMSADARALLPMLWLLASEDKDPVSGLIRDSYEEITFRLRMNEKVFLSSLDEIRKGGFITLINARENGCDIECNETVTKQYNNSMDSVTPETETETETETENNIGEFEEFWKAYQPYEVTKGSKHDAMKEYFKAAKETTHEVIMDGLIKYMDYCHTNGCKTKQGFRWLSKKGWKDDYQVNIKPKKQTKSDEADEAIKRAQLRIIEMEKSNGQDADHKQLR